MGELKIYGYLAIITAIIAAFGAFWHEGKKAGYNEAVVDLKGANDAAAEERITKITAELNLKITQANTARDEFRDKLVKLQSEPPKEVKVYVEKIKTINADCPHINGFSELWNGIRGNYTPL